MAERLALPTSDQGVAGSNPAGGEILPEPKQRFIAQSLSCSPFHRLEMTEILLKGRKTLTHPSIHFKLLKQHYVDPYSIISICHYMLLSPHYAAKTMLWDATAVLFYMLFKYRIKYCTGDPVTVDA